MTATPSRSLLAVALASTLAACASGGARSPVYYGSPASGYAPTTTSAPAAQARVTS